jgi:hypothetical protein
LDSPRLRGVTVATDNSLLGMVKDASAVRSIGDRLPSTLLKMHHFNSSSVMPVAGQREAQREDAVLVLMHHPLEQALSAVHHSQQDMYSRSGCKAAEP